MHLLHVSSADSNHLIKS